MDDREALDAAATFVSSEAVSWFPAYGCALLALGTLGNPEDDTRPNVDDLVLYLVGLDEWSVVLHR